MGEREEIDFEIQKMKADIQALAYDKAFTMTKLEQIIAELKNVRAIAIDAGQDIDEFDIRKHIAPGIGLDFETYEDGKTKINNRTASFPALFDLYEMDDYGATLKVMGHGYNELVPIAGTWKDIGAGAGGIDLDTTITISSNTYIYVKIDRENIVCTLEVQTSAEAGSPPDGNEAWEPFVLWYIPWNSGNSTINWYNIVDYRSTSKWDAGA